MDKTTARTLQELLTRVLKVRKLLRRHEVCDKFEEGCDLETSDPVFSYKVNEVVQKQLGRLAAESVKMLERLVSSG